jgi:hypothetical protein
MLLLEYITWHYGVAPASIVGTLRSYLIGTWHRFLITHHMRTLFAPWHRMLPSQLPSDRKISTRVVNFLADIYVRIIAAMIRLAIVIAGLIYELVLTAIFFSLLVFWLLWPVLMILALTKGITLLI